MKPEEAIKILEECHFSDLPMPYMDKVWQAHRTAEEALRKMIPMKPEQINYINYKRMSEYYCSCCKAHLYTFYADSDRTLLDLPKFCKRCGQAIDWEG